MQGRLLRRDVERPAPAEIEVDRADGLGVGEIVHLLQHEGADEGPDALVRAAAPLVAEVAEVRSPLVSITRGGAERRNSA